MTNPANVILAIAIICAFAAIWHFTRPRVLSEPRDWPSIVVYAAVAGLAGWIWVTAT